jgi:hypothetical protein
MANSMKENKSGTTARQHHQQDLAADGRSAPQDIYAVTPGATQSIVVAVFADQAKAEAAVGELGRAGFRHEDISLVMRQPEGLTIRSATARPRPLRGQSPGYRRGPC